MIGEEPRGRNLLHFRPRTHALAAAATLVLAACGGGDATPPAETTPPGLLI